jgi:hypothetical protein
VGCTEGTIERERTEHICTAAGTTKRVQSFSVRLADGSTVERSRKQLATIPAGMVSALVFPHPGES